MRSNTRARDTAPRTHEGARLRRIDALQELRRTVLTAMLFEDTFYESGQSIAERIRALVPKCRFDDVAQLAVEARTRYHIRHASLLLARELLRHPDASGSKVGDAIHDVIQRADEPAELMAMYRVDTPMGMFPRQLKLGIARALRRFDAYQLAKYRNEGKDITLRDVFRAVHPLPENEARARLYGQVVNGTLPPADTWEHRLMTGSGKKESFEALLYENRLGYMALLRNLRKMTEVGVDRELIRRALTDGHPKRILPFRFISAAKHAPQFEKALNQGMLRALETADTVLQGKTAVLVDVSGSMSMPLSSKSQVLRYEAAAGLAILANHVSLSDTYIFGTDCHEVSSRADLSLVDTLQVGWGQTGHGTCIGKAIRYAAKRDSYDRFIVITDGQSHDPIGAQPPNGARGYVINVAPYKNGVGYGPWHVINGFSEATIRYIEAIENLTAEE